MSVVELAPQPSQLEAEEAARRLAAPEPAAPEEAVALPAGHGEIAGELSFEQAIGATGCSFLRSLPEAEARQYFNEAREAQSEPHKLVMPSGRRAKRTEATPKKTEEPKRPEKAKEDAVSAAEVLPEAEFPQAPARLAPKVPAVVGRVAVPARKRMPELPVVPVEAVAPAAAVKALNHAAKPTVPKKSQPKVAPHRNKPAPKSGHLPEAPKPSEARVARPPEVAGTSEHLALYAPEPIPQPLEAFTLGEAPVTLPPAATESVKAEAAEDSPAVVLDHFVQALSVIGSSEVSASPPGTSPAVAQELSARLAEISSEQKETVMPIVQNLVQSLEAVRALRLEAAPSADMAAAVGLVAAHTRQLCEVLGERDAGKMQTLIRVLVGPAFAEQLFLLTPKELEGMGTHEFKHTFRSTYGKATASSDSVPTTSHILGSFALFVHPHVSFYLFGADQPIPVTV